MLYNESGALLVGSNEVGPEVNTDKMRRLFVSRQENAGQNHHIRTGKKSFEKVSKLHASRNQIREMATVVRFRNALLPVSYLRMYRLQNTEISF
jgi:hypothetical protein